MFNMVIKKLKRWGNSLVFVITKEEEQIYNLTEGDLMKAEKITLQKNKKRGRK